MGRPRSFDEAEVLIAATTVFQRLGYEGTSIDDLVAATGLHRGSLYKAFASKRGLFLACLRHVVSRQLPDDLQRSTPLDLTHDDTLDLVLVAALEICSGDEEARGLVDEAIRVLGCQPELVLGRRLLKRARLSHNAPVALTD